VDYFHGEGNSQKYHFILGEIMARIYFLEDDAAIRYVIEKTIENIGYDGYGFETGDAFKKAFKEQKPDMILLDIMLPDTSGMDVLKWVRKQDDKIPVMMISALNHETDKVHALDAGADDYMTKPFGVLELTSRIQAKLRYLNDHQLFSFSNIVIDDKKHRCMIDQKTLILTNKEYDILKLLVQHANDVVTKEMMFKYVWSTDYIGETRTLDMHIKSLRKKLLDASAQAEIKTVRGVGYMVA
jgi:two-component system, OmpR family, alkaline phosphatase synthesis response regulator PhoP